MKKILIFGLLFFVACKEKPTYVLVRVDGRDLPMENYGHFAIGENCFVQYRQHDYGDDDEFSGEFTQVTMCSKLDSARSDCPDEPNGEPCTSYWYSTGKIVGKCEERDIPQSPELQKEMLRRAMYKDKDPNYDGRSIHEYEQNP